MERNDFEPRKDRRKRWGRKQRQRPIKLDPEVFVELKAVQPLDPERRSMARIASQILVTVLKRARVVGLETALVELPRSEP